MLFYASMLSFNEVPTFMHVMFDPLESKHFTPSLQVLLVEQNSMAVPEHVEG